MLDHRREQDLEREQERRRPQQPAPVVRFGTLGWASAVGSQAVARIARQAAEEALGPEMEGGAGGPEAEPEVGGEGPDPEAEGVIPGDLPEELPA